MKNKRIKDKLFGIVIGVLLTSTIGYAAYKYQAIEVGYTPINSNFDVDNVSDAIKELYAMNSNCSSSSSTDILGNIEKSENFLPNGYYKSTAEDNNVIFGGYCWKIIRKTDNDDIRMIYNGTPNGDGECTSTGEDTQIDISKFSTSYDISDYEESTVKTIVDNWYDNNLATNYSEKVSNIDLITREEATTVQGGYLVSGEKYWTKSLTGKSTTTSSSCTYTACEGEGTCESSSNAIYIVNTSGTLEESNNGTFSTCSPEEKTCQGACNKWYGKTSAGNPRPCSSYNVTSYGCCQYAQLTGICTATPEGSSLAVRPVITLKNTVTMQGGNGKSISPYYLK